LAKEQLNFIIMKSSFIGFLFSAVISTASYSQVKEASQNLKQQVNKMAQAFISGDYKTFVSYTYKPIVQGTGGAAKMEQNLTKVVNDMKLKGMSFNAITFDEPSKIIKSGKELQATIAQHTDIKVPDGRAVSTSTLIAISTDNGINWTFIDTSNKDMATLRKALPNLSPLITVPPPQAPVRYNS
jgi:hypothetical protein